jgi:aminomethyltransferase
MLKQTALHDRHLDAGARLVDFGGWSMPLHYGSQLEEHHTVRQRAGVFDVSHMTVIDVSGACAEFWLRELLANDIGRCDAGQGLYSCMLNDQGGVLDDLIAYRLGNDRFRVIVNAATRDKDLAWMQARAAGKDVLIDEQAGATMLAVQGPQARTLAQACLSADTRRAAEALKPFQAAAADGVFVARTGYTGEDGYELVFDCAEAGAACWDALLATGVRACGLGARDTLRLEAGLPLYGQDLDEEHSPLVSGLGWTVAWEPDDRRFVGRGALEAEREAGPAEKSVGLLLEDRGIMRSGQRVNAGTGQGRITSGGFSPTLERSIALARLPANHGDRVEVEIRKHSCVARVVKPRFVRNGQALVDLEN